MLNRLKVRSNNYDVIVRRLSNPKDGEYYDFLIVHKKTNLRSHFGFRVIKKSDDPLLIAHEIFFFAPRGITNSFQLDVNVVETGEAFSESQIFDERVLPNAKIRFNTEWSPTEQKCFLRKLWIEEVQDSK